MSNAREHLDGSTGRERALWMTARSTAGAAVEAGLRIRHTGLERLPETGPALIAYNHISVLDAFVVGLAAWKRGHRARFLGLASDFDRPIAGPFLRGMRMIPVRRGLGDWAALEAVADALRAGDVVAIAPEGTIGDGTELQPLQRGAARISLLSGTPIIPVGLWGTQQRWGKRGFNWSFPIRPTVDVVVGAAVQPTGDPKHRPDVLALTERLAVALEQVVTRARGLAATPR